MNTIRSVRKMAVLSKLSPFILKWEGGFVNDPRDSGGATNMGVTLNTWKSQGYDKNGDGKIDVTDLKLLTKDDVVERIMRPHYWNRWKADRINDQRVANLLVDWVWLSGKYGITIPQRLLGVAQDGIVGEVTLAAVNGRKAKFLVDALYQARVAYLQQLVAKRPKDQVFMKGWMNRLNDLMKL